MIQYNYIMCITYDIIYNWLRPPLGSGPRGQSWGYADGRLHSLDREQAHAPPHPTPKSTT